MKNDALNKLSLTYDSLQNEFGDPTLDSIKFGGCAKNPDLLLVFMNPTKANIAANKDWQGIKAPWIGTKNIWKLLNGAGLMSKEIFKKTQTLTAKEWSPEFTELVYTNVANHGVFITNLGKCTQVDARPLSDAVFREYLDLLIREIDIVKPKKIVTFGNQVSSIILGEKICVSKCRKECFNKTIASKKYAVYPLFYPVGQGMRNLDKAVEDLVFVRDN